jgi:hypothetical protein
MRMTRISLGAIVLAAVAGVAVAAQQTSQPSGATQPQTGGQMDMSSMMTQCQQDHQAMGTALDKALATIREARQSNDPSRMRAALEQVEASLAGMQQRVSVCTTMMNNMSNMMGMMMGMMGGRQGMGMRRGQPGAGGTSQPATPPAR